MWRPRRTEPVVDWRRRIAASSAIHETSHAVLAASHPSRLKQNATGALMWLHPSTPDAGWASASGRKWRSRMEDAYRPQRAPSRSIPLPLPSRRRLAARDLHVARAPSRSRAPARGLAALALGGPGSCLSRSLAIAARAPGSEVVIGVTRKESGLEAHARVEIDRRPLSRTDPQGDEIARLH